MKLLIIAGHYERTLLSKILPLMELDIVDKIYLVRRDSFQNKKIECYYPRGIWRRGLALSVLCSFFTSLYLAIKMKPEILIGIGLVPHGIITYICSKFTHAKNIILIKGDNDLYLSYDKRKLLMTVFKTITFAADKIGVRGNNSKKLLIKEGMSSNRIFIAHNVFDFNKMRLNKTKSQRYDLIYVGIFEWFKRVNLIVDVVYYIKTKYDRKIRLALVGKGPLKPLLEKKVNELHLNGQVKFLGHRNLKEINDILNQSKVFILPSVREGLPMALVEALSCGVPAVAADKADMSTIVHHGENGFLVESGSISEYGNYVYRLLSDDGLYQRMSNSAPKIREEKAYEYSLENAKNIWRKVLSE